MKEKLKKLFKHKGYWYGVVGALVRPPITVIVKESKTLIDDAVLPVANQVLDAGLKPDSADWFEKEVMADQP